MAYAIKGECQLHAQTKTQKLSATISLGVFEIETETKKIHKYYPSQTAIYAEHGGVIFNRTWDSMG